MGSVLAAGACCCVSCCCKECAQGCSKWLGEERVTKIFYFLLVVSFAVPIIVIFYFLNGWDAFKQAFNGIFKCPEQSGSGFECLGSSAVYRLSLCLLILFFVMMLCMLCRSRLSMAINESCFFIKYFVVCGLFIGSLWISNTVFDQYSQASQYLSIAFMCLQCIILIDLFYLAGIGLVKGYDAGSSQYCCYLITLSIFAEGVAVSLNVLGYVYFASSPERCNSSLWVNIVTSIMLVIMPIIQLLRFNEQNSLLTTSLVSAYIAFLNFIAQFSFDAGTLETCSRMDVGSLVADICISTFFFVLTMYGSIMGGTGQVKITRDGDINKAMGVTKVDKDEEEGQDKQTREETNEEKYTNSFQWLKWHFYMCLASIYVGMLATNWTSVSITQGRLQESAFGFWVRVSLSFVTFLLYVWTMIAPRVCPSRDFRIE